jgi:predicted transglutaminase-like cysteine proteinase
MWVRLARPFVAACLCLAALCFADIAAAQSQRLAMRVNGWTNPPIGYLDFCRHFPDQCRTSGGGEAEALTDLRWRDLQEVNTFVNRIVVPATDLDFYSQDEVWTLPETYGDCEDYVLLKRKWLIERGWPSGALLITVVFDEFGDGHAVLLARTSHGDLVLDNKTDAILPWYDTAYRYVKRQSTADPNRWVSLGDPRWSARATATSR